MALAEELEYQLVPFVWCYPVAVAAAGGDWERSERYAAAATDHASACLDRTVNLAYMRATLAAERGRPEAVLAALEPLLDVRAPAVHEPGFWPWPSLYADALVDVGRLDDAQAFLPEAEARAVQRDRPSMIAALARSRGRLAMARGERERAIAAFEHALTAGERVAMPYERALTELAYGEFLRRINQRRAAASHLASARDAFASLGARPALDRSERELRACGLRPAKRSNADPRPTDTV